MVESLIARFARELPGARFGFWRTLAGAEVDLIVEYNGKTVPIEIKLHSSPLAADLLGLAHCITDLESSHGIVAHGGTATYTIGKTIRAVPVADLLLGNAGIDG